MTQVRVLPPQQNMLKWRKDWERPIVVDVTDGYSTVGKKVSEQGMVTIMAACGGSNPPLSTIAPLAHSVRATDS